MEYLLARIQLLESILSQHGIQYPSAEQHLLDCGTDDSPPSDLLSSILDSGTKEQYSNTRLSQPLYPEITRSMGKNRNENLEDPAITQSEDPHLIKPYQSNANSKPIPRGFTSSNNIVNNLANRLGTLHTTDQGDPLYFGATSNLHVLSNNYSPVYNFPRRTMRFDSSDLFIHAGVDFQVPEPFEEHLLNLFFAWENPLLGVVQKEPFMKYRHIQISAGRRSSELDLLCNVMCIFGAAFSDCRPDGITGSLPEFFDLRARILLDAEIDHPKVTTVQALVILSSAEAMLTMDSRAWLYSGKFTSTDLNND